MAITTIYLIRHAHADWQPDEARPLSAAGAKAAQEVGKDLSGLAIQAIYSSPSRRAVDTVTPLADALGLRPELVPDLRERGLPIVPAAEFDHLVQEHWRSPDSARAGGESNVVAQRRGIAVLRSTVTRHVGQHVVISTHGNLLALILNGLDSSFGYDFWSQLSFPDVYRLEFDGGALVRVERMWRP